MPYHQIVLRHRRFQCLGPGRKVAAKISTGGWIGFRLSLIREWKKTNSGRETERGRKGETERKVGMKKGWGVYEYNGCLLIQAISYVCWLNQLSLSSFMIYEESYAFIQLVVNCSVFYFFADILNETSLGDAFVPMPVELTHDQQDRLSRIRAVCREMNQNSHVQLEILQHIWVDLRNKILVCAPPNVGSNTLKHILLSTAEYSPNLRNSSKRIDKSFLRKYGITSLDTFRPVQAKYMLHNFRKIMFVRHPLERLASVYDSQFGTMNYQCKEFQKLFRRTIIRKFRLNATTEVRRNGRNATFQQLVKYVISLWENWRRIGYVFNTDQWYLLSMWYIIWFHRIRRELRGWCTKRLCFIIKHISTNPEKVLDSTTKI